MNQLFYNIAGRIVHQIWCEKQTKISEVIVCGERNIKQNRNWFYFKFSVERSSFISQSSLSFVWFYRSVFLSKFVAFHFQTVKRIVTALMPSLLFRCFSLFLPHLKTLAQEKRSQNLYLFGNWWAKSLFVSLIVAKYNIFTRANNGRSHEKQKFWRSDLLTLSACTIGILSTLMNTEIDYAALLAML